jgi:spermidine/putrescine transport system permease protein
MGNFWPTLLATTLIIVIFFLLNTKSDKGGGNIGFFRRNAGVIGAFLFLCAGFWLLFMVILPMTFMVDLSFHHRLPPSQVGGPNDVYTLVNYRQFLFGSATQTNSLNGLHLRSFAITIATSVLLTVVNFAVCYPIAFYMAQKATIGRLRLLFLLLFVPFWVNDVLRAFAFRITFSDGGFVNSLLMAAGLVDQPVDFLGSNAALYMALCYTSLLVMIFPLYNAIESLDRNQIEAARDLGAPWWHIHLFVVMPHAKPGIASGMTMCFMLTAGSVAIPQVLEGTRSLWFTQVIYDRFYQLFDWPQGAAYAFVLVLACTAFVLAMLRISKLKLGEIAR